jgi:sugar-specific transcriptional regulator TrmB
MSADDAVEALQRLGLSSYEASVFVALQQRGGGTARDVAETADVPRSQVYGVADDLAERGLVELVESSPKRYRPVSLEAAHGQLEQRLEREQDRAFENLEAVRGAASDVGDEGVTTLRGRHPVQERVATLVEGADERAMYVSPTVDQATGAVVESLRDRAADGVDVLVATTDDALDERFAGDPVRVVTMDGEMTEFIGRTLLVDEGTVLLSVIPDDAGGTEETALWTADSDIGRILGQFINAGMERGMDRGESD